MGLKSQMAMVLVGYAIFKFLTRPPPELSAELQAWKEFGKIYDFETFQIFYLDKRGSGNTGTLVCLHGFPTSSFDWTKVLGGLERQFSRIILPDFLGFGFSDKPTQHKYTVSEQADMVEALLHSLTINQVHLLSHDFGDTVAQELVARFNERKPYNTVLKISSLSMLNGGVFIDTYKARPLQKLLLRPWLGPVLSGLMSYPFFKHGFGEVFGPNTQPTSDELWDFWTAIRYNRGNRVLYRILQYIPERYANKERWVGAIQKTTVPVHMIYGPSDPVNPPEFVAHYRKVIPHPSITVLPDEIGHYPQWEAPESVMKSYSHFLNLISKPQVKYENEEILFHSPSIIV